MNELISKLAADYFEENITNDLLLKILEDACRCKLISACRNLNFFLKEKKINLIRVRIDLGKSVDYAASYEYGKSDFGNGGYVFSLSRDILPQYLGNFFDSTYTLTPTCEFLWEHELLHAIDHNKVITHASFHALGFGNFWINYLLKYRKEGVAELFGFFRGNNQIKSRDEALKEFQSELLNIDKLNWKAKVGEVLFRNQVNSTNSFYTIGPWMVLHALSCSQTCDSTMIDSCLKELSTNGKTSHLMTTWIIRKAVNLDNNQFIKALSIPGIDGKTFLTQETIKDLNFKLKLANILTPGFPVNCKSEI